MTVLILFMIALASPGSLFAQGDYSPDEYFDMRLREGYTLDKIRNMAVQPYGIAVATEIAVYRCSPDAEPHCDGTTVYAAWDYFQELIQDNGYHVDEAAHAMLEHYDEPLVTAIAVHWCSPPQEAGCEGSRYAQAWNTYLAQLSNSGNPAAAVSAVSRADPQLAEHIAAFECAEPTCYANEIARLDSGVLQQFQSAAVQSGNQRTNELSFANNPGKSQSKVRQALCKAGILKSGC